MFETPSVETYIAIVGAREAGAGNWHAYRSQQRFEMREDLSLSKLIAPIGTSRVLVFERRMEMQD